MNWKYVSFSDLALEELYEVLSLRSEVFVVEQNCVYQDIDFKDQKALHVLGKNEEGKLIAYTRLFGLNEYFDGYTAIGRVITHPEYRKYGFGGDLMKKSIEKCIEFYGDYPIKIGAQKHLTKFYGALGFKEIGEDYMEDGIPHCIMIRENA
ncbi:GNAT family N-acetyltransferase [Arcticibacterium luteifluviistationis]|uniref:GNAT family N-acetyltransferase n=2 Tax=Arcticibacterium luteifluviistationis TaxID=1784714 RepID=A0A2Z4GHJ8_9BACT|nr:GNAT family N-acetyltransferase [Arcticibacterium luteifluviistationis]